MIVNARDVLSELASGEMALDEVEEFYDAVMEWNSPAIEELLGMTHVESTSFAHGVYFKELSQWRATGWPTRCHICSKEIEPAKFGWFAQEQPDEAHLLVHMSCL